jgi:predicted metal-binding membrane protein
MQPDQSLQSPSVKLKVHLVGVVDLIQQLQMELVDVDQYQQTLVITPDLWNQVDIQAVLIMYLLMDTQSSLSLTLPSIQITSYGARAITQQGKAFLTKTEIL